MNDRNPECVDPKNFQIENLPRVCGNDVFETVEEYKRIEAVRVAIADSSSARPQSGESQNGTNGDPLSPYIPSLSQPVKTICCRAHIFQDSAGQQHFQPDEVWRIKRIFDWASYRYASPNPPSDTPNPAVPLISDTRIRFALKDAAFYQDNTLHVSTSVSALQAAAVARDPNTLRYLNVYLTAGSMGGAAAFATLPSTTLTYDSWVVMLGVPPAQSDPNYSVSDWAGSNIMAHEFGHVLDLLHTYLGGGASAVCSIGPNFLSDVFGTNPNTCPHICNWGTNATVQEPLTGNVLITNNVMGGNKDNFWISARQAALMHRALTEKSVQRYLSTACDCLCCVAFTVRGLSHVSAGVPKILGYATVDLNEGAGWTPGINTFVCPTDGVYQFSVNFVGNATGGVSGDVFVFIQKNGSSIARAWSAAPSGQRNGAGVSVNVRLQTGDLIRTVAGSGPGTTRYVTEYHFEGHLICGCCS